MGGAKGLTKHRGHYTKPDGSQRRSVRLYKQRKSSRPGSPFAVLADYAKEGQLLFAWQWFRRYAYCSHPNPPNVIAWSTLINACIRAGYHSLALAIFDAMLLKQPFACSESLQLYAPPKHCHDIAKGTPDSSATQSILETYTPSCTTTEKPNETTSPTQRCQTFLIPTVPPNMVTYTTMLKGLCQIGDWHSAVELTQRMHDDGIAINSRTINTLLRGCSLWGWDTLALNLFTEGLHRLVGFWWQNHTPYEEHLELPIDAFSFVYILKLLCRKLFLKTMLTVLRFYRQLYAYISQKSPKWVKRFVLDASVYNSMSFSIALMGEPKDAESVLSIIEAHPSGEQSLSSNCLYSNDCNGTIRFQNHKLHESILDKTRIKKFVGRLKGCKTYPNLSSHFLRLYYFPYDYNNSFEKQHSTALDSSGKLEQRVPACGYVSDCEHFIAANISKAKHQIAMRKGLHHLQNIYGFGAFHYLVAHDECVGYSHTLLNEAILFPQSTSYQVVEHKKCLDILEKADSSRFDGSVAVSPNLLNFLRLYGMQISEESGCFCFPKVFSSNSHAQSVHMEIGSGNGDWITYKARKELRINWLALELRYDRCYQIFSRMVMDDLKNCCIIGGDASRIINQVIPSDSITTVYINFPEPPTTHSKSDHWLNGAFFRSLFRVLVDSGEIIIVTDDEPYCHHLASELTKLKSLYHSCHRGRFYLMGLPRSYEESGASSYFDRLWKNGSKLQRFHIQFKKFISQ